MGADPISGMQGGVPPGGPLKNNISVGQTEIQTLFLIYLMMVTGDKPPHPCLQLLNSHFTKNKVIIFDNKNS